MSTIESFWRAVGADFGTSGFVELPLYLFLKNVGPELSSWGPDPSHRIMQIAPKASFWRGVGVEICFICTESNFSL